MMKKAKQKSMTLLAQRRLRDENEVLLQSLKASDAAVTDLKNANELYRKQRYDALNSAVESKNARISAEERLKLIEHHKEMYYSEVSLHRSTIAKLHEFLESLGAAYNDDILIRLATWLAIRN